MGSKAETRLREGRVEDRRQDLLDGLLDDAIQHVGDAEHPLSAAVRLGDGFPADRFRPVGAIQELLPYPRPMLADEVREVGDSHAVGTGGPVVGFHRFPGPLHVRRGDNLLHQVF